MKDSTYSKIIKLVTPYWGLLILSTISAFIYVVFNSLSIWLTASLFYNILSDFNQLILNNNQLTQESTGLNDRLKILTNNIILRSTPLESLKVLCITLLGSFFIKNLFLYVKNISVNIIQYRLITKLRGDLYSHLQKMSMSYFDKSKSGELSSIVINDVSKMRVAFGSGFHKIFVEPINILTFITLLFIINVKLALISLLIVPLTGAVIVFIAKSIRRKSARASQKIASIMNLMSENLNSIRVVKAFTMEDQETEKFKLEQHKHFKLIFRQAKLSLISAPITEFIGSIIAVTLLWIGGVDVLVNESMNSEDFIRFILILFSALAPIKSLSNVGVKVQDGIAAADRVFSILNETSAIVSKPNAIIIKEFKKNIIFDNVKFRYDTSNDVLKGVSFKFMKGKVLAIVGPSGAGKSTLADLLPRFYDINSGSIKIDGNDLKDFDINSLRKLMGIVSQDSILFNDSIEKNIAYGLKKYSFSDLETATKIANAYDFIMNQPKGFKTIIGEKGTRLSGGQKQRLAIARAILKNPPILILDEATSSLDTESERLVQSALETLMNNRSVIVIAHRLSTIKRADHIIVMDKGQIISQGNHDRLLSEDGLYAQLYKNQFDDIK